MVRVWEHVGARALSCSKLQGSVAFRPFIEVWVAGELAYSSFKGGKSDEARHVSFPFQALWLTGPCQGLPPNRCMDESSRFSPGRVAQQLRIQ